MNKIARKVFKQFLPPIIVDIYRKFLPQDKYGFFGNYSSWQEALSSTTSYETEEILSRVKESLIKVRDGQVAYERDSVVFDEMEYSYPLLTGLLIAACENNGELNVVDFGGSLGSTYFQNKTFLKACVKGLKWNIIEQEHFVNCGKQEFENDELKFYYKIKDCLKENKPNVLLFGSSLQYIGKPLELLEEMLRYEFEVIIIDRTLFVTNKGSRDIITKQIVNPQIYKASYPAWFFNKNNITNSLGKKYNLIVDNDYLEHHSLKGFDTKTKCLIFKKR